LENTNVKLSTQKNSATIIYYQIILEIKVYIL